MSSENLAKAERQHAEMVAQHQAALEKQKCLDARLSDTAERMKAISQRRIDGTSNDAEAAEFAALHGDAALLEKMLATAKAETAQAFERVHGASCVYNDTKSAHERQKVAIEYECLRQKCADIEAVFCRALGMVARAGKKLGHHTLSQSYRPSDTLHRALNLGVAPEVL